MSDAEAAQRCSAGENNSSQWGLKMSSGFLQGQLMGTNVSPSQRHPGHSSDRVRNAPSVALRLPCCSHESDCSSLQALVGVSRVFVCMLGLGLGVVLVCLGFFSNPLGEGYRFRVMLLGPKENVGRGTDVKEKVVILKWK